MAARDIVVIGASAGGPMTIRELLSSLPSDFKAVVLVALHRPPFTQERDYLAEVLSFKSSLQPRAAVDGQRFTHGEIYVPRQIRTSSFNAASFASSAARKKAFRGRASTRCFARR